MSQLIDHDWTEDFDHENGQYTCLCTHCGKIFIGHKRRVTCKRCAFVKPVDILIFCPVCGKQHVDKPEPEMCECKHSTIHHNDNGECIYNRSSMVLEPRCECRIFKIAWTNPPHKSHTCRKDYGGCGNIFRIADFPTNGVERINTVGKDDTWKLERK